MTALFGRSRRRFLKGLASVSAVFTSFLAGVPIVRAFVSPMFVRGREETWLNLGEVDNFDLGIPNRVDVTETVSDAWFERRVVRGTWVYTDDGENYTVYNGICTHLGCSYAYDEEKDIFDCPCHHALYAIATGEVLGGPAPRPLDTMETRITDGVLYVRYEDYRPGISDKVAI